MTNKIMINDEEYNLNDFSLKFQEIWGNLVFTEQMIRQFEAQKAIINKARNGYIDDLKFETIEQISGVDFESIFSYD